MYLGKSNLRTVVLLGAGATRGALAGIGRERIRAPLNRDFFRVAARFVQTRDGARFSGAYGKVRDFVEKEVRLAVQDDLTMEGVFNVLFMSKDLPAIFRRGGPPRAAGFRREITDFLRLLVGLLRHVQENGTHRQRIDHHLALARALIDGDAVLSLNYDTLMDNALMLSGWNPADGYGFSARGKVKFTNIGRAARHPKSVLLLKPHGSLNWFAKGTLESFEDVLARQSPSRLEMSPTPRAYDLAREGMVRFFIPPLYAKFFANRFWRGIWETAFEKLVDAEALVVVGCSMIESDFHLRSIVGRALARRKKKFKRLLIAEPNRSVRGKLRGFLRARSESGFEWFDGFTELVNERL